MSQTNFIERWKKKNSIKCRALEANKFLKNRKLEANTGANENHLTV